MVIPSSQQTAPVPGQGSYLSPPMKMTTNVRRVRTGSVRFPLAALSLAAGLGLSACSSGGGLTVDASGPSSLGTASNVSCTPHAGDVTVAGTFACGPASGIVGFSTTIYDSNGRQIGSGKNVSIEVESQQSASLRQVIAVHGDPSSCTVTWGF